MIAWREGVFADATLYVNPGLGDAWLFVNEGSDDARTSYSHWTDLRSPPPAPTRELPFHFEPSDDRYGDKIVGPRIADADAIPTILERGDENADCARVLLHADGSFGCIPHLYHVMADGWRLDPRLDDGRLANVETGDLVVLEMGPDCVWPAEFTPDPPRAYYPFCFTPRGDEFIWSPDRTVRVPAREPILGSDWSENRHVRSLGLLPHTEDPVPEVFWLDMVAQQLVHTGHVYHLDPWRYDRFVPYTHEYNRRLLLLLSLATGRTQLVHKGCVEYVWMGGSGPRFAYSCLGRGRRARWTAVIDTERAIEFRLPPLRQLWLRQSPPIIVGIVATHAGERLVAWPII